MSWNFNSISSASGVPHCECASGDIYERSWQLQGSYYPVETLGLSNSFGIGRFCSSGGKRLPVIRVGVWGTINIIIVRSGNGIPSESDIRVVLNNGEVFRLYLSSQRHTEQD